MSNRLRGILFLVVFGICAALLLTQVNRMTRQRIAENELAERLKSLTAVLSADNTTTAFNNQPHQDVIYAVSPELLGSEDPLPIYRARQNGNPVAAVITASTPDGFSGDIKILVAISSDGQVTGVRVVTHVETPGLGDAIDANKSAWIKLFSGLSLTALDSGVPSPAWTLVPDGGEFDQITGATVTSRAVLRAVNDAAIYFIQNRDEIFSKPAAADTAGTEAESP